MMASSPVVFGSAPWRDGRQGDGGTVASKVLIWISLRRYLYWRRPRPDLDFEVLGEPLVATGDVAGELLRELLHQPAVAYWQIDVGVRDVEIDRIEIGFAVNDGLGELVQDAELLIVDDLAVADVAVEVEFLFEHAGGRLVDWVDSRIVKPSGRET